MPLRGPAGEWIGEVKIMTERMWRFHSGELDLAAAQREVVKAAEGSVG
jgi:hypothetical protein